jgi:hypothetical protein
LSEIGKARLEIGLEAIHRLTENVLVESGSHISLDGGCSAVGDENPGNADLAGAPATKWSGGQTNGYDFGRCSDMGQLSG